MASATVYEMPNDPDKDNNSSGETLTPGQGRIALDFDRLRREGFYAPSASATRLSLELRAIKRRLLRRIGYRKRSTGKLDVERCRNVILMTSTRPAEGKTFTSVNLALSLANEDGIKTLLIDGDIPRPRALASLGVSYDRPGFSDLIADYPRHRAEEMMMAVEGLPLTLMGQGGWSERSDSLFAAEETEAVIRDLSRQFPEHLIIIDAPPVLAMPDAVLLARACDEVLFVIEANATPETAVASALEEVLEVNENVSVVLNRCLLAERTIEYGSYDEYYRRSDRRKG